MVKTVSKALGLILCLFLMSSCGTQSGSRAAQGAGMGGIAGAAGGVVSALIFGGNVGDAAARGAVWGATSGAVSGAIVGSQEDKAIKTRERAEAEQQLKKQLGEDGFAGLAALATCKYPVALGYAESAQQSKNDTYMLAGLWLETITKLDQGDEQQARQMYPKIIAADKDVTTQAEVQQQSDKAMQGLMNIRKQYNLPVQCRQ